MKAKTMGCVLHTGPGEAKVSSSSSSEHDHIYRVRDRLIAYDATIPASACRKANQSCIVFYNIYIH